MKRIFFASLFFSSVVLANTDTYTFDLEKNNLVDAIPKIISSLNKDSSITPESMPMVLLDGKNLESYSQDELKNVTTDSLSKIEYLVPNAEYPNGLLLLGRQK